MLPSGGSQKVRAVEMAPSSPKFNRQGAHKRYAISPWQRFVNLAFKSFVKKLFLRWPKSRVALSIGHYGVAVDI